MKPVFALVDCNNFFVSCERVFRPDLANKPVAVLSSNDGCIVARSQEVKKLGIPMGAPEFKYRNILRANKVTLFSANFELYGDFSRRIVEVLMSETPYVEVYSVDESFLEVSSLLIGDYKQWADNVRKKVYQQTGIPVSVGVARSKTLAKAASELAKQNQSLNGALSLVDKAKNDIEQYLRELRIEDIWGIGAKSQQKLNKIGITNAYELSCMPTKTIRKLLGVNGERTLAEINGVSCISLSKKNATHQQKQIAVTRSFGSPVNNISDLELAVANFAAKASAKARTQDQIAGYVVVFLRSKRGDSASHNPSAYQQLAVPSAHTSEIIEQSLELLRKIYSNHHRYTKAGVILTDLKPSSAKQTSLTKPLTLEKIDKQKNLMQAIDKINQKWGTSTVKIAAQGLNSRPKWLPKSQNRSPRYTTKFSEIPKVRFAVI